MIIIKSKQDGFRRCGVAHTKQPVEHPDDKFSEAEIAVMEADPMLTVKRVLTVEREDELVIAKSPVLRDMTVAALKDLLDTLNVKYDNRATKAVLIGLVDANTDEPYIEE
ncbi:MAG: hypothetical protein JRE40_03815 [Deltaproteobacteria bacterium]|nr:hypothetical protein [Deltaproteobacteria bacterium]